MSKKKTLADLMDNDFFIDFDNTEEKAKRKQLAESLKRKRTLTESIEEPEVESCYKRIVASAAADKDQVIEDPDSIMIAVEVSKEHLKKALKLGAFGTYGETSTVPARYVESVDLEFSNIDEDNSLLSVQLHGEYNDESVNDYIDDVCFVQFRDYPAFDTEEEALEFFETEIRPNATKIAEEMIDEAWAEAGCTDYEGITDLSDVSDDDLELENDTDLFNATSGSWEKLIDQADSLLAELARKSGNDDYDDGDGYWVSEHTVWCNRYIYYTNKLNNEANLDKLCNEYSKKLPGVTFYYNIDADEELCELGYEANKQIEESVKEPDNTVVDCKVNRVIAHSEDEKPVDCLGEKKPLEKPLTEGARSIEEIKAEIAKLQQELADAMAAEKKASYSIPEVVYVWDIYLELHEKGNWTSAEEEAGTWEGTVFETAEDAKNAAWLHLKELEDEGKLEYESSAYYIDAFDVPLNIVSDETLSFSGLDHLIA